MKIACVIENIYTFGGTQRQFIRVVQNIARMGHRVEAFTTKIERNVSDRIEETVPVTVMNVDLKQNFSDFAFSIDQKLRGYDWVLVFDWDVYKLKYHIPRLKICWICNDAPYAREYM